MRVRLGYACISMSLDGVTSSSNYTYTKFKEEKDFNKLNKVIKSNFNDLEKILDYNISNNIHFYRISPKLIPLATHKDVSFDYISKWRKNYRKIASKIRLNKMRVDLHPDQFCVLNSVKEDVVNSSIDILKYCYILLREFRVRNKVIIIHIGGNTFGKDKSLARFVNNFKKLPTFLKRSIVIENDDKIFNVNDCLYLNSKVNVAIVFDYHHHICNSGEDDILSFINNVFDTWKNKVPKVHFSSPRSKLKNKFRSHHDYIDVDEFISFIEIMKKVDRDFDIMIEAKMKDDALFRLVRQLKYKTNYKFIDDTTFLV